MGTRTLGAYDQANFVVRREAHRESAAGATASIRWHNYQKARLKAVHVTPIVVGTVTDFTQAIFQVSGTATTTLGTLTLGTTAIGSPLLLQLGTDNTPKGITLAALDETRITNAVDATGTYGAVFEYEVLPDALIAD